VVRDPLLGRVVVAMRDSGDELEPEARVIGGSRLLEAGMATGSAERRDASAVAG
jgi:hypothetical protein